MRPFRLVPDGTKIDFVRVRWPAFVVSFLLVAVSIGSIFVQGLNLGIDFRGGILLEVRTPEALNLSDLRRDMGALQLGEVQIQEFGGPRDILIRVQRQPGGDAEQAAAVNQIRAQLGNSFEYRRVEVVGPSVGAELMRNGILATVLAVLAIGAYVAVRFEWQFGVAALVATAHDVIAAVGLISFLQLEFNLAAVAALLTLAGYSINDTVVVFDRIRENLRRFKTADLSVLINEAVNQTLSRTIMTSGTTLLAVIPLLIWGGEVLRNFTAAITFGIIVGTFSSVYVGAALLLYMPPLRRSVEENSLEGGSPDEVR